MFVATANTLSSIPGPLLDRMEIISIAGYTELEKVHIAREHLLPKQLKEHGLRKGNLQVRDEALLEMIRYYTREAGVRTLERQIAKVCRKAAKIIVTAERKRIVVTEKNVVDLLGKHIFRLWASRKKTDQVGMATGLAYTAAGGDTLAIEVSVAPGKGKLILTGETWGCYERIRTSSV